ncbi:YbaB/EbfC family nucleoid-associated protein [Candidatus Finniella inopinata]|uniref:Nucleoid-associated protein EQU50_04570 n=1 Tax=Candidatus Finniella inopinata TaxID=1696036 RepID=A0A4Q7DJ95_9PROT|nr:YbaB/EbfC family nucleoid-associated protein [Candidatus Finniella inopinata]RZI46215.1 YbaB/EbfC family nucleoid-associated protein [Candidatus Finniella inopinata]
MKNLNQMLKQAQQLQAQMGEMQKRMEEVEVSGNAGGGMIQVTVNGKGDLKRIKIDPALIDPKEVEILEDLIVAACHDAKTKAEAQTQEEMSKLTGGLNLPGGMKLPF